MVECNEIDYPPVAWMNKVRNEIDATEITNGLSHFDLVIDI